MANQDAKNNGNTVKRNTRITVEKFKYSWGTKPGQTIKKKVAEFHCKGYRSDNITGYCNYNTINPCKVSACPGKECQEFQGEGKLCFKQVRTRNCPAPGSHERCIAIANSQHENHV